MSKALLALLLRTRRHRSPCAHVGVGDTSGHCAPVSCTRSAASTMSWRMVAGRSRSPHISAAARFVARAARLPSAMMAFGRRRSGMTRRRHCLTSRSAIGLLRCRRSALVVSTSATHPPGRARDGARRLLRDLPRPCAWRGDARTPASGSAYAVRLRPGEPHRCMPIGIALRVAHRARPKPKHGRRIDARLPGDAIGDFAGIAITWRTDLNSAAQPRFDSPGNVSSSQNEARCTPPVMKAMPVTTSSTPTTRSTVPKCARKRFMKRRNGAMASAATMNGTPSPGGIDAKQAGAARDRVFRSGQRQDRREDRPDARRPAEGEGEAHDIGAPKPDRLFHAEALLAIQEGQPEQPEKMQAHRDDEQPGDQRQDLDMGAHDLPECRGGRAERHEHRGETGNEQERREQRVAPRARFAALGQFLDRRAGDEGEVRRHQRQDAWAQKRKHPRRRRSGPSHFTRHSKSLHCH